CSRFRSNSARRCSSSTSTRAGGRSAIRAAATSSSAAAIRRTSCPIAHITAASPISRRTIAGETSDRSAAEVRRYDLRNGRAMPGHFAFEESVCPAEPVVERIARAADGADRIRLLAAIDRLTQATDMHVDGALVDIDVRAQDTVEQLLA